MRTWLLLLLLSGIAAAGPIRFAPLPMDIAPKLHQQYSKMLQYLEKETGIAFEFVYCADYDEVMEKFRSNAIDIAELGPLPYVNVQREMPYVKPFLTFLTKEGNDRYTCKLLTTDPALRSLDDLDPERDRLYLTSRRSTCGPLMMRQILAKAGKQLDAFESSFAGTHSNVILQVLLEEHTAGGVKSTVYESYAHFGLRVLGTSEAIPGFAFAANTRNVSPEQIDAIQEAILKLHPRTDPKDWEETRQWGKNIRYGARITDPDAYRGVIEAVERDHDR